MAREGTSWSLPRKFWWLFRNACLSAHEDNCLGIAKSAAYSGLLSFFPLLTTLTAVLVRANARQVSESISNILFVVAPPGTQDLIRYTFTERGERPLTLPVAATLLSLWGASGVIISLMQGFRAAYRIPKSRPILQERGMAVLLVFATALPVIVASGLIVFGDRTEEFILQRVGVLSRGDELRGWVERLSEIVRYAVTLAAIVLAAWFLYYLGPNSPKRARAVWPGALLATVLWWLATALFGYYVRHIANYNLFYGSIGAVIALLVWMYLLAIIALLGCEYNAQRERLHELYRL